MNCHVDGMTNSFHTWCQIPALGRDGARWGARGQGFTEYLYRTEPCGTKLTSSRQAALCKAESKNNSILPFTSSFLVTFRNHLHTQMGIELWASGFNAFNQLNLNIKRPPSETQDFLGDLSSFTLILEDEYIEIVRTSISAILSKSRIVFFFDVYDLPSSCCCSA